MVRCHNQFCITSQAGPFHLSISLKRRTHKSVRKGGNPVVVILEFLKNKNNPPETNVTGLFKTFLTSFFLLSFHCSWRVQIPSHLTLCRASSALSQEMSLLSVHCRPPWRFLGCLTQPKSDILKSFMFFNCWSARGKKSLQPLNFSVTLRWKVSPFAQSPKYGMWPNCLIKKQI